MRPLRFSRSPLLDQSLPPWRQRFVLGLLLLGFGTLVGRSLYLQGIRNDFLGDQGRARYERVIGISATRGRITDRQGNMLAVSRRRTTHAGATARSGQVARYGCARADAQAGLGA